MVSKSTVRATVLAAATVLFSSLSAYGGQTAARSAGDDAGGVVVVLEHVESGKVIRTRTDAKGNFSFSDIESGKYRLRFGCGEAAGASPTRDGKAECLAEMRIEISDKSKGNVAGTIQKAASK